MSSEGYHEKVDHLSAKTKDMHRGIVSLMEELEAIDWYNQRIDVCTNDELKEILIHNKKEEMEHAAMLTEWLRRNSPNFSDQLKDYLFTDKKIGHH